MGSGMSEIISVAVGVILIAAILPTALSSLYQVNTGWFVYGGGSTGTNDTATVAIFKIFPLFAVLAGLLLIIAPVYRHLR